MVTKSTSRKAERRDRRKQDILDAASELFSKCGYENVTLRAIAEQLGYAHATLYRYFPDKSSLLAEICRDTFDLLLAEVERLQASVSGPKNRLFQTSRGFVHFGLSHPQHFRIVFFGPEDRNGIRAGEYIDTIGRPLFDRLVSLFSECSEAVGFDRETRVLDAHTWWTALFGITQVLITSGPVQSLSAHDALTERLMELLWAGLETAHRTTSAVPRQPPQDKRSREK